MIEAITLPWPPSVNRYWRMWRGRMLLSRQARAYRRRVCAILADAGVKPASGPLAVHIELYPPDRRKRDVDNAIKAINDSLEHGDAFYDDAQITWLLIEKLDVVPEGKVVVHIAPKDGGLVPFPLTGPTVNLN